MRDSILDNGRLQCIEGLSVSFTRRSVPNLRPPTGSWVDDSTMCPSHKGQDPNRFESKDVTFKEVRSTSLTNLPVSYERPECLKFTLVHTNVNICSSCLIFSFTRSPPTPGPYYHQWSVTTTLKTRQLIVYRSDNDRS